ncbi:hypothetical protein CEXT_185051 [Caerostris extrusa]|uniref:Uncharacterized protein n=1 Tax=Caerostris extrusa TaxID=172846 RepID=A0AAV4RXE3_CAEEX|nr:hypothetical protein CEXT_185051 [Caerostris extrusa]
MFVNFCNAYIANFEVHSCRKFGNQQRQSSATLPRSSSDIKAQDIDSLSAQQTDYEAQWPFNSQSNSSTQQNFLPNMQHRIDCGEKAAAETSSQLAVTNQNLYNPETSVFCFLTGRMIKKGNPNQHTCNIHLKRII